MGEYKYSTIPPGSIRLLHLLPCSKGSADLQGKLITTSLRISDGLPRAYEALSYCWEGQIGTKPLVIRDDQNKSLIFKITENLHAALLCLRDDDIQRALWIDAVCIDQQNDEEKVHQIQFMAAIYAKARRVIVWLGEAGAGSDEALESIRVASEQFAENSPEKLVELAFQQTMTWEHRPKPHQQGPSLEQLRAALRQPIRNRTQPSASIQGLLQRSWFRRIWVLQEMAAARHVIFMCGLKEIDGHAFCLGLASLDIHLEHPAYLLTHLIRGAVFRSRILSKNKEKQQQQQQQQQKRVSLDILSLGELLDMYHAHLATKRHDKIFALLGMSSDDGAAVSLKPDYNVPWGTLMQMLVRFLLGNQIAIATWNDKETAIIRSKGIVLGKVSLIERHPGGKQNVQIAFNHMHKKDDLGGANTNWILQTYAIPIEPGDIICLLEGASQPSIIRSYEEYAVIITIAAGPLDVDNPRTWSERRYGAAYVRDFMLIWDWKVPLDDVGIRRTYDRWMEDLFHKKQDRRLDHAQRTWNAALILGDAGAHIEAEKLVRNVKEIYKEARADEHDGQLRTSNGQLHQIPLLFAAASGDAAAVELIATEDFVDPEVRDWLGRTPLLCASNGGHEAVVKLLLETVKAYIDAKDLYGQTALWHAVEGGHEAIVELLFEAKMRLLSETSQAKLKVKSARETLKLGMMVKLLLETGKANVEDLGGLEAVMGLLAEMGNPNTCGQTALSWAAAGGYKTIVKLLLESGKANIVARDKHGRTVLSMAAAGGHEPVVRLLLEAGNANVAARSYDRGRTALLCAAANGNETVVRLLLETGNADVKAKDYNNRTALSIAAEGGHEAIVKLLLETGKADVAVRDRSWNRQTALHYAAANGHEGVARLLLETGRTDVEGSQGHLWGHHKTVSRTFGRTNDALFQAPRKIFYPKHTFRAGRTALHDAAERGNETVVRLLLETGRANVEAADTHGGGHYGHGRTALHYASAGGHEAVVRLLLETGKVDVEARDNTSGRFTSGDNSRALHYAAARGHEAIIRLLLEMGRADIEAKDARGLTALKHAQYRGHEAVVRLLQTYT